MGYRTALPESQKIAGLIAFYNGMVDIYLDGELHRTPAHTVRLIARFPVAGETVGQCRCVAGTVDVQPLREHGQRPDGTVISSPPGLNVAGGELNVAGAEPNVAGGELNVAGA
ncbi:hypothetical protein NBRGN_027_02110 [Nocardia brasiliensis NBRC 14402]|uniref:hypothetical protein n=1 Tax=Nocardia brasiliensis TaxID=37326 RepID=UPI00030F4380|nr:hypothetical protein [Nocardia brasiliensis]GAJ80554.1 hypothetical protein NBRGN_027_02110 [Nocardia brasiliensis NBRC 14402]SUB10851.1 Uncharacterised protein [Nocardia brasiliensis]